MKQLMICSVLLPGLVLRSLVKTTPRAIALGCFPIIICGLSFTYFAYAVSGNANFAAKLLMLQVFAFCGALVVWTMIFLGMGVMWCVVEMAFIFCAALFMGNLLAGLAAIFLLILIFSLQRDEIKFFVKTRFLERKELIREQVAMSKLYEADILLLTASQGSGHIVAAENIANQIRQLAPGKEILLINLFDYLGDDLRAVLEIYWQYAVVNVPNFYRSLHRFMLKDAKSTVEEAASEIAVKIEEAFKASPSVIVAIHPMAVAVGSILKKEWGGKLIVVPTDFFIHPHYFAENVDFYCLPTYELKFIGIDKNQVLQKSVVTGIPISSRYNLLPEIGEAKRKIGIPEDKTVVFVSFGRAGLLSVKLQVELISFLEFNDYPFHFLVPRAVSNELRDIFKCFCKEGSYSFIDDIPLALAVSDAMIGKAGGLSVSEAMACGVLVGIWSHTGPEDFNTRFLIKNKFGKKIGGAYELLTDFRGTKNWILSCRKKEKVKSENQNAAEKVSKLIISCL